MRFALILLAGLALASCKSEAERKAEGLPAAVDSTVTDSAGNRRGLVIESYSEMQAIYSATPVLDPQTGCEYLLTHYNQGGSLSIRHDRHGVPMCPGAPKHASPAIDRTK